MELLDCQTQKQPIKQAVYGVIWLEWQTQTDWLTETDRQTDWLISSLSVFPLLSWFSLPFLLFPLLLYLFIPTPPQSFFTSFIFPPLPLFLPLLLLLLLCFVNCIVSDLGLKWVCAQTRLQPFVWSHDWMVDAPVGRLLCDTSKLRELFIWPKGGRGSHISTHAHIYKLTWFLLIAMRDRGPICML